MLHLVQRVAVVEEIAREFGVDTVIMIPDKYLARNVAKLTGVKVITWGRRLRGA